MRARQLQQGFWMGALLLIIVWLGYLIWGLTGKVGIAWRQERETRVQYTALEMRKSALEDDLNALQTPRGQDAAIREAFGVAKPGEEVIVVVPPTEPTSSPHKAWWQWLFGWL